MASGCFPIVTDLEGTRPFIQHGKNGLLVPVNNPQKLADSMELFLTNSDSFSQAVRDNRTYIEAHVDLEKNMDLIWKRYLQLFNS
jgi:glycosyltransferase involved in cell wall biosynthesis